MTCEDINRLLVSFLAHDLSPKQEKQFRKHLAGCASCARETAEFETVWRRLDAVPEETVPLPTKETIYDRIYRLDSKFTKTVAIDLWYSLKKTIKPLAPLFMGLLTTIIFAFSLSFRTDLKLISPLGLTIAGGLWTGLFTLVYYLFSMGGNMRELSWRFLAQATLIAVGIFLLITAFSPLPHAVRFCSRFQFTQPFMERLSLGGTYFLFGTLYSLIPMTVGAYFCASRWGNKPILRGSIAGAMFMLLLTPGIFLQCAPFALGIVLGWFGGALVGSVVGGVLGFWARIHFAKNY